jgi:predicted transcriptional regulator
MHESGKPMGTSTTGKPGTRAATFKLKDDLLRKINVVASVRGQNNSEVVDEAVKLFIALPEIQALLRAELESLIAS